MLLRRENAYPDVWERKTFKGPLDIRAPEDHLAVDPAHSDGHTITSPAINSALIDFDEAMKSGMQDAVKRAARDVVDATSAYFRMSGVPTFAHDPVPPQLIKAALPPEHLAPGEHTSIAVDRFVDLFDDSVKPVLKEQVARHLERGDARTSTAPNDGGRDAGAANSSVPRGALNQQGVRPMFSSQPPERDGTLVAAPLNLGQLRDGNARNPQTSESRDGESPPFQQMRYASRSNETHHTSETSGSVGPQSPYDPEIDDEAKNLQYYGYDPAFLSKNMPGWRPIVLFDDRIPEGYNKEQVQGGLIRLNRKGFGGYLAHRKGTRDFAIMIKGVEASEFRLNDFAADDYAGADQVDEVGDDVFRQCKAMGVFDSIKHGGRLTVIGHSQGAPSAQLLGVYLIVRALNERPPLLTEEEALRAIKVRAFGGIGARDYLDRLHGPDGSKLSVPESVLERIDAVTYIVSGDPLAQRASVPYIGRAYVVDAPDPKNYEVTEGWAKGSWSGSPTPLRSHARSAYKAADYRTARPYRTWRDEAGDFLGGLVDQVTDWIY